ncbi:MAG: SpaA isopeptide-forming pilin-related protein [Longicatena sp.]
MKIKFKRLGIVMLTALMLFTNINIKAFEGVINDEKSNNIIDTSKGSEKAEQNEQAMLEQQKETPKQNENTIPNKESDFKSEDITRKENLGNEPPHVAKNKNNAFKDSTSKKELQPNDVHKKLMTPLQIENTEIWMKDEVKGLFVKKKINNLTESEKEKYKVEIESELHNKLRGVRTSSNVTLGAGTGYSVICYAADGVHMDWNADYPIVYVDGEVGFCIDPGILLYPGGGFTPSSIERRELSLIAYEGWEMSSKTNEDYLATQFMIWEAVGGSITSTSFASYSSYKSRIQNRIQGHSDKPSFDGVKNNEINVGQSLTIPDTKNILNKFSITSTDGLNARIEGNNLVVTGTLNAKDNATIKFSKINAKYIGTSIVYRKNNSQEMAKFKLSDPIEASIGIKVNKFGNLIVNKSDEENGNKLSNTTYNMSYHADMSNPFKIFTTDVNGYAKVDQINPGSVYFQEVSAKEGYVLDETIYVMNIKPNETTTSNLTNKRQKGQIEVIKQDVETGNHAQGDATLSGWEFEVRKPNGSVVEHLVAKGQSAKTKELDLGEYQIFETLAPKGYVINPNPIHVTIRYAGQNVSVQQLNETMNDSVIKGKIQIVKKDKDTNDIVQREGFQYEVYFHDGTLVDTITSNKSGVATSKDLPYGSYYVKEIHSGSHYVVDVDATINTAITTNGVIVTSDFLDKRVNATINLEKKDYDNNPPRSSYWDRTETPQGDATLDGAIYGLYARNNIMNPCNDGSVLYAKNTLVAQVTTKEAKATVQNLYLGEYYWKEIKASEGYELDPDEHDITLNYEDENTLTIVKDSDVYEHVITGRFDIEKIITDGENSEIVDKEEGAEFLVVLKKYVTKYGSIEKAYAHRDEYTKKEYDKLVTDEDGYAKSNDLAYGTYIVKQIKGQIDTDKYEAQWEFKVDKENQEPIRYIINNRPFTSYLKLVKKDLETNKEVVISSATFKIWDVKNKKYISQKVGETHITEFKTDTRGYVVLPLQLKAGEYRLDEIHAPKDYMINTDSVNFKITNTVVSEVDKDGDPIKIVELKNQSVKGQISITKKGEVLTETKVDKDGNIKFIYKEQGIAGMKVNVVARKDILDSADGTLIYKAGTIVETITTKANGSVKTSKLPLGSYYVQEIEAPKGFVLNDEKHDVDLLYKDQETPIISKSTAIQNKRQKVDVSLMKKDFDNDTPLSGAIFGLYAKEDILEIKGSVVIKAGTLIEKQTTNEKGKIEFVSDLPLGKYEIKEIQAPIGYSSSKEVIQVDATYRGQDIKTIPLHSEFKNKITKLEISKSDITTDKELPGNLLTIYEKGNKGSIVDTWISTDEQHMIKGMEVGKTYVLHEISSVYGFAIANDIEFVVQDSGDIQKVKMENKVVLGKLGFHKSGLVFKAIDSKTTKQGTLHTPLWERDNLLGAEITIYAAENITLGNGVTYYEKDQEIETIISDYDTAYSKLLPVGKYYYKETKAPIGYVKDNEKYAFEIKDNQKDEEQIIESILHNERAMYELDVRKTLETNVIENKEAYKDVVFGVFARDDTYDVKGNVILHPNSLLYTSGIDDKGKLTTKMELPVGNFYLKELSTNEAYVLDTKEYDFSINQSNEKHVVVPVNEGKAIQNELKDFKVKIHKVDHKNKANITNKEFSFTRYRDAYCTSVIETGIANTSEGTLTFENVNYGITYIKETKAPQGYQLSNRIIKVEVNEAGMFINDKKIESKQDSYQIQFENEELPLIKKVKTSDDTNMYAYILITLFSSIVLLGTYKRSTKEKNAHKTMKK